MIGLLLGDGVLQLAYMGRLVDIVYSIVLLGKSSEDLLLLLASVLRERAALTT